MRRFGPNAVMPGRFGAKAHSKNPGIIQTVPFDAMGVPPDIRAEALSHEQMRITGSPQLGAYPRSDQYVNLDTAVRNVSSPNMLAQTRMTAFSAIITGPNIPVRLCPLNGSRVSYVVTLLFNVANDGNYILMSFGPPAFNSGNLIAGIAIGSGNGYQDSNSSVPINDIWVTAPITAFDGDPCTFPMNVVCFEGTLAADANNPEKSQ